MGDIINLRQARKAKARKEKAAGGAVARAKHGAAKADTALRDANAALADRAHTAHRREQAEPAAEQESEG